MIASIDAATLKTWLSDGREIALLDVREAGQFGESHLFFAVPLPYSRFELHLPALVPNPGVRLVLCDGGDEALAERAARRAQALGYRNVHILDGGTRGWRRAGYTLYAGVNVPSKTFGELVEHEKHTPRVTAHDLEAMRRAGDNMVIVDGRTFAEFRKMNIPGGICCPNGELVLRIGDIVPDPKTKIIVNCAGRTRSIIGAQTLIDFGVPNPVFALENGTQGWTLAGLELENGAQRRYADTGRADTARLAVRARELALARGVAFVTAGDIDAWLPDAARTTYLLDVRTAEEHASSPVAGFAHAPGGQLVQATDQWVGVKGARIVLLDGEGVRAPVIAGWLRQLGHEAYVLDGGLAGARGKAWPAIPNPAPWRAPKAIGAREVADALAGGTAQVIDLRPAMSYRAGHIVSARWSIRPRVAAAVTDPARTIVLVAEESGVAALAALDLAEAGCRDVRLLTADQGAWREGGMQIAATPDDPADEDCIDFLFFTHGRHEGNAEAARQYLAWEIGLVGQLDAQERAAFRIAP
ncbi:MAG TPA: rhodanese-like domain-containing protein [Hyphomicrobiaceae bacterium]|nr:rhodanese-like domain-containing protein [Hyphomicrobiaceae bacterium]